MKFIRQIILLTISIFIFSTCTKESKIILPSFQENVQAILPLGDSRVEGFRPDYESYRYELWKNFVANDWSIDFVGTQQDDGDYPTFQGMTFDTDHEGTGGAQTIDILNTLKSISSENTPSIVLLGIGGNDILDGQKTVAETITNIEKIIDELQSRNANITIFLEQIAPAHSDFMTTDLRNSLNEFNQQIVEIGNKKTTNNSKIVVIDMASNWSDAYMADKVHYNEAGAKVVADRYFEAIEATIE